MICTLWGCGRSRPRPLPASRCVATARRGIHYAPYSPHQTLDIYEPNIQRAGPFPTLVWLHGGAWATAAKRSVRKWALRKTCDGFVVISVGYRLSWEAPFRAQLVDVKNAVRFIRMRASIYRVDPHRIYVWGASAGAHLASLTGLTGHFRDANRTRLDSFSSTVAGVIHWWGPTDFLRMNMQWPDTCEKHRDAEAADSPESILIGCPARECPDAAQAASPLTYVSSDAPPFLIMAGEKDCTVPPRQSKLLHEQLLLKGVDTTFHLVKGAGHGDDRWADGDVRLAVDAFLDRLTTDSAVKTTEAQRIDGKRVPD